MAAVIVLDASVVIAALNAREHRHSEAVELMARPDEDFVMHSVNVAEVLVLAERHGQGESLAADLRESGVRTAEAEPLQLARVRVLSGLKMPDCCALSLAKSYGVAIATFDDALARAAHGLGIPVEP